MFSAPLMTDGDIRGEPYPFHVEIKEIEHLVTEANGRPLLHPDLRDPIIDLQAQIGIEGEAALENVTAWGTFDRTVRPGRRLYEFGADLDQSESDRLSAKNVLLNLAAIATLFASDESAPGALYDRYEISNFRRYRTMDLQRQLSGERHTPFSVVVSAATDWNTALTYGRSHLSQGAIDETTIFAETKSGRHMRATLDRIADRHGVTDLLIANAHGNEEGFCLEPVSDPADKFTDIDLFRGLSQDGTLSPEATLVLFACFASKRARIGGKSTAAKLAESTGLPVIGPYAPASKLWWVSPKYYFFTDSDFGKVRSKKHKP